MWRNCANAPGPKIELKHPEHHGLYFCSKCSARNHARGEDPFPYCANGLNSTWFPMEDSPKSHDSHGSLLLTSQKTYEDTPTNQHTPNTYPTHTQHIPNASVKHQWFTVSIPNLARHGHRSSTPAGGGNTAVATTGHCRGAWARENTGTWHAAIHGSLDQESTLNFFQRRNAPFFLFFFVGVGSRTRPTNLFSIYCSKENQRIFSKSQRIKKKPSRSFHKHLKESTSQRITKDSNKTMTKPSQHFLNKPLKKPLKTQ